MGASASSTRRRRNQTMPTPTPTHDPRAELRVQAANEAAAEEGRVRRREAEREPQREQQPQQQPRTHKTTTIRNHVNLGKSSLEVIEDTTSSSSSGTSKIGIAFKVDADKPCRVSVAFRVEEKPKEGARFDACSVNPITRASVHVPSVFLDAGLGQRYEMPRESFVSVGALSMAELTEADPERRTYPVVVRLECVSSDGEANQGKTLDDFPEQPRGGLSPLQSWSQSQTTYIELRRDAASGHWSAHALKQKIWVHGSSYELQEIYGIESCGTGTGGSGNPSSSPFAEDPDGEECVICLSEPRDTTVLPCRHLCMCAECAHHLRSQVTGNVCPICRNPVESLLEIKVAGGPE
jgi:E3 ubiquitin-protein ligase MGRN1